MAYQRSLIIKVALPRVMNPEPLRSWVRVYWESIKNFNHKKRLLVLTPPDCKSGQNSANFV